MLSNLLIYRFVLLNTVLVAAVAGLVVQGYVAPIFISDDTRITWLILALFAIGWGWCLREVIETSRLRNAWARDKATFDIAPEVWRDKDLTKIEWLGDLSSWLVLLGLIGTIVGLMVALGAANFGSSAADTKAGTENFMHGIKIALGTNLLGSALSLWHEFNYRLLRTALSTYWCDRLAPRMPGNG